MANNGLQAIGRVKLADLIPSEGLASDTYKLSISTLSQSLTQYSAAIIQFPSSDSAVLRSCLESSRLYFNQKPSFPSTNINSLEWCKTSGYYSDPQNFQENYDFRPGLTPNSHNHNTEFELAPAGLSDVFALLGKAARDILNAISFYLNLRSCAFTEILDSVPLRNREISSSVLSVCCHSRLSFQDENQLVMFSDHENFDKSLISLVKSDKAGFQVRDFHGRWILIDGDLGPQEAVVYTGLALYQATAGYVSPALYRIDGGDLSQQGNSNVCGRCSVSFKLMPKSMTSLNCSEMRAAGHVVESQFQIPISVDDFMQRSHPTDQLFNRHGLSGFSFPVPQDGSMKPLMKRKRNCNNNNNNSNNSRSNNKPLPPSKRLRLEAQRVLKERVQDIADKKGIKLRFCNLKDCESHILTVDSPCANIRMEIGWPPGVPFVHPHDLPNKAKMGFLEAYEPGCTATQEMQLSLVDPGQHTTQLIKREFLAVNKRVTFEEDSILSLVI